MNGLCQCTEPGNCSRYGREMRGRFWEICQGINVDLGTAAAFRNQWDHEAHRPITTGITDRPEKHLLLRTNQAPGDAVAMTAAIYSLHKAHPGRYKTAVESYWPEVFEHNPDVSVHLFPNGDGNIPSGMESLEMHYPAIHQSNERGIHFMQGWCEFLGEALGIHVPLLTDRPRLYFDTPHPTIGDYWLVCSGGKRDFTNKLWGYWKYRRVVNLLHGKVKFVQVGGAKPPIPWNKSTNGSQEDDHPRLPDTIDMIGKTTLRQLFDLVRGARGVLCGVSLLMHVAAALDRPAIVIAGGREPRSWNAYPLQAYISTAGWLPCKDNIGKTGRACWRARTFPLGDGTILDNNTCEHPLNGTPKCMELITPEYVSKTIMQIEDGNAYIKTNGSNARGMA